MVLATIIAVAMGMMAPATASSASSDPAGSARVESFAFESPSHNIACVMSASSVRCDISAHTYDAPPRPAACQGAWGDSLSVRRQSRWTCHGDTVLFETERVLPYGDSARVGRMECTSRRRGVTCQNLATGHGFRLASASVDRF